MAAFGPTLLFSIGQGAVLPVVALSARDLGASVAAELSLLQVDAQVEKYVEMVHLGAAIDKKPSALSGGDGFQISGEATNDLSGLGAGSGEQRGNRQARRIATAGKSPIHGGFRGPSLVHPNLFCPRSSSPVLGVLGWRLHQKCHRYLAGVTVRIWVVGQDFRQLCRCPHHDDRVALWIEIDANPVTGEPACTTDGSVTPGDPATDPTADADDCLTPPLHGTGSTCGARCV